MSSPWLQAPEVTPQPEPDSLAAAPGAAAASVAGADGRGVRGEAERLFDMAWQHCQQCRPEAGRPLFERALEADQRHVKSLYTLGLLHCQQDQPENAQPLLELVLDIDPLHVNTLHILGLLHYKQGHLEEAQQLWERALDVDQRNEATLSCLGELHFQQGRPEEARRWCEEALAICPESRTAQYVLYKLTRRYGGGTAARFGAAAPPALEIGSVVRVDGLAQRPELNGSHGTVRSFDAEAGR